MSLPNDVSRRSFLKASTAAAALTALGAPAVLAARSPNETLNVGCIGTGGRCRTLMKSLVQVPNVRIAAVCDIYDAHLNEGRKLADPKAVATKVYKEILDNKDIDAVLIGAPDHWHVPMAVDALAADKDVYVEKPLTHRPEEGKAILEAQAKSKRIVQVGMQQRSHAAHREGPRTDPRRPHRQGLQGPSDLEPQPGPRAEEAAEHRPQGRWTGRRSSATRRTSRSTNTATGTGVGSGTSAAASSPTWASTGSTWPTGCSTSTTR